ncbi:hypothetical protein [Flaviaesturariibacter amylovorans]
MKIKFASVVLLSALVLSMSSCASRKYGCPSTVYKASTSNKI